MNLIKNRSIGRETHAFDVKLSKITFATISICSYLVTEFQIEYIECKGKAPFEPMVSNEDVYY